MCGRREVEGSKVIITLFFFVQKSTQNNQVNFRARVEEGKTDRRVRRHETGKMESTGRDGREIEEIAHRREREERQKEKRREESLMGKGQTFFKPVFIRFQPPSYGVECHVTGRVQGISVNTRKYETTHLSSPTCKPSIALLLLDLSLFFYRP